MPRRSNTYRYKREKRKRRAKRRQKGIEHIPFWDRKAAP